MSDGKVLCETPRVVLYDKFLSDGEIARLLELSKDLWKPSTVVENTTGESVVDGWRTGDMVYLNTIKDPLLDKIKEQTGAMLKVRPVQAEGLQLVRYGVGNQYKVHHDWFDPSLPGPMKSLLQGGQRIRSAIVCLKAAEEGGETEFPNLMIKVKLEPGQAVVFENLDHEYKTTTLTDHAGLPVIKGEKVIMPIWIRERAADGSEEAPALTAKQIAQQKIAEAKVKAKQAADEAERAMEVEAEHRVAQCAVEIAKICEKYNCRLWAQPHVELNPQNGMVRMYATPELNSMPEK